MRDRWPDSQLVFVHALREIKNAEHEVRTSVGEKAEDASKRQSKQMQEDEAIAALHRRMLEELETRTFADIEKDKNLQDEQERVNQKYDQEMAEHNKNLKKGGVIPDDWLA